MGIRTCRCPERLQDFIGRRIIVHTSMGVVDATLDFANEDYLELSKTEETPGGTFITYYFVLCCQIQFIMTEPIPQVV